MSHKAHSSINKSFIVTALKAFLIFTIIFSFVPEALCSQSHIEKKRKETHAKVVRLKRLESIETNKLYKNQQRLENATKKLKSTKQEYKDAEQQLLEAEKNLNETLSDFSATEILAKKRIKQGEEPCLYPCFLEKTRRKTGVFVHLWETTVKKWDGPFSLQFSHQCAILFNRLCPFSQGTTACIICKGCGLWKNSLLR